MIRVITDRVGTSGSFVVWPDTDPSEIDAWLTANYKVDEALSEGIIDDDIAQEMRDSLEVIYDWATGDRPEKLWDHAEYLNVELEVFDETEFVEQAAKDSASIQDALHEVCRRAVACGVAKTAVAQAAGITRPTLDKWLAETSDQGSER